jgi:hypothetical protein
MVRRCGGLALIEIKSVLNKGRAGASPEFPLSRFFASIRAGDKATPVRGNKFRNRK